jgi:hypothetical protein
LLCHRVGGLYTLTRLGASAQFEAGTSLDAGEFPD